MATASTKNVGSELAAAFTEFDRGLRVRQARLAYVLGLFLIPSGWMLDYFVYPSLLWKHLEVRLICSALLLPCLLILFTKWGQRHARITDKGCTIIPMLAVCWMIYTSEGAVSPYYAGLNFTLVGACLVLPYNFKEGTSFTIFVMGTYLAACLLHGAMRPVGAVDRIGNPSSGTLAANLYFLLGNGMICAAACHYRFLRRFEDFRLRHELAVNNEELASTLTKLKETEVQLVQSEKMNALGKLSAGLLHEVNNPLNFTFMALQMAEQEAEGNASLQDTLKDIGQGMTRIRGVISDLRAFAHPTKGTEQESFGIDETLTTALRLCAHEMGDIPVARQGVEGARAMGSKTQIVHVFMNLLVNSAHATRKRKVLSPQVTVSCEPDAAGRLKVSVLDNGTGVKPEHLPRLLEPFFTTKDVGEGMGLGLSICHTIVKNHGGTIDITSKEGEWTRVSFDLPLEPTKTVATGESGPAFTEEPLALAGSIA